MTIELIILFFVSSSYSIKATGNDLIFLSLLVDFSLLRRSLINYYSTNNIVIKRLLTKTYRFKRPLSDITSYILLSLSLSLVLILVLIYLFRKPPSSLTYFFLDLLFYRSLSSSYIEGGTIMSSTLSGRGYSGSRCALW